MHTPIAPEQHWQDAFAPGLTEPCARCERPYAITILDHDRGVNVCPACVAELTEQSRAARPITGGA